MPDGSASSPEQRERREPPGGTRPLSRRATRILVIVLVIVAIGLAVGASYFLVNTAQEADPQQTPADSVQVDAPSPRQ